VRRLHAVQIGCIGSVSYCTLSLMNKRLTNYFRSRAAWNVFLSRFPAVTD